MFKKGISTINNLLLKSIFKRKRVLISFVFLFLILFTFLTSSYISNKKTLYNRTNFLNQSENEDNLIDSRNYSNNNTSQNQSTNSFDKVDLINDNRGVPVLYYHSVQKNADNEVIITPKTLKYELQYIKDQGYTTLTMNELYNYLLHNSPIPKKSIVITFDDGYMDNYYNAFPILKDLNMKATIFCITSNLDGSYYLSKEAINEMLNYGIDIESHTVNHLKLNQLTYSEQLRELQESKKNLESITGKEVYAVAYPFGAFNDDSIKAAKAAGYKLGFTTNRGLSDRDDNPLKLDRIYISSNYSMNTFKEILSETKK
jgi:peptidoglycan/xylan/chitin deacetylase (PgdA/CDA1 family)